MHAPLQGAAPASHGQARIAVRVGDGSALRGSCVRVCGEPFKKRRPFGCECITYVLGGRAFAFDRALSSEALRQRPSDTERPRICGLTPTCTERTQLRRPSQNAHARARETPHSAQAAHTYFTPLCALTLRLSLLRGLTPVDAPHYVPSACLGALGGRPRRALSLSKAGGALREGRPRCGLPREKRRGRRSTL